jgi:uncharacterized protein YbcV (DUF1398 family)
MLKHYSHIRMEAKRAALESIVDRSEKQDSGVQVSSPVRTDARQIEGSSYKGWVDVPPFNRDALIAALRTDQAGNSSFQDFLAASWRAGVVRYDVDFAARKVTYYGCNGEEYIEDYPAVDVD